MLNNEESQGIFRLVKLRRLRLAGHVAKMGKIRDTYKTLADKAFAIRLPGKLRNKH
jgi:hypothetical protein